MSAIDPNALSPVLRRGLYEAIFGRRDMREFRPDPIPNEVLARVLVAAHRAGSVGFTQPWDFVIVRDLARRRALKAVFEQERRRNADQFSGARREKFLSFKLEGIIDAPLNIIVTCRAGRFGPAVLGKTSIDEVEVFSTCLAVQNLWLAARAEGLGVGWVSILRNQELRRIFEIPDEILPVAYLCCGYVEAFPPRPQLETAGWADRISPRGLLHFDSWERLGEHDLLAKAVDDPEIWRDIFPNG
ncbi:MAG TPA: 5,6-dimethylbenzimidazole synthase [Candidatus Binataceae bacterium]|jgi:5,6-dimethylbenzimidazole synthase